MSNKPLKVVLLPFPLTVLSAFAFYAFKKLGLVSCSENATHVGYHWMSSDDSSSSANLESRQIEFLFGDDLTSKVKGLIDEARRSKPGVCEQLSRILSFLERQGDMAVDARCSTLVEFERYLICRSDSLLNEVLKRVYTFFDQSIKLHGGQFGEVFVSIDSIDDEYDPSECTEEELSLDLDLAETSFWKRDQKVLREANAFEAEDASEYHRLQGKRVVVIVGGRAGYGKSTLIANLYDEMRRATESLKREKETASIDVSVSCLDLDLMTPTLHAIQSNLGRIVDKVTRKYQSWNLRLVRECLTRLTAARGDAEIVLADIPGHHKRDEVAELLCSIADLGILVTKHGTDGSDLSLWAELYRSLGIMTVSKVETCSGEEESHVSQATEYIKNTRMNGMFCRADRCLRSGDPFVTRLAYWLLLERIPAHLRGRQQIVSEALRDLANS